jgi:hypothetical protein
MRMRKNQKAYSPPAPHTTHTLSLRVHYLYLPSQ